MPIPPAPYSDYVPAADADFNTWLNVLLPAYGASGLLLPLPADFAALGLAWGIAYAASSNGATRGPATIAAKDVARANVEAVARLASQAMVAAYNNGDLTAAELTAAGVRVPSTLLTPRLPPTDGPDLSLRYLTTGVVNFSLTQSMSSSSKKPPGVVGAEIWRGEWTGDPSAPPANLSYDHLATKKVAVVDSTLYRGEQVRFCARWLTVRGAVSPFGPHIDVYCS